MKSEQSNTIWNRNKVTADEIETKYPHMKSKQSNTIWNRNKVTLDETEAK